MRNKKEKYLSKKLKTIEVKHKRSISELLNEMSETGFQGRKLGEVVKVFERMVKDKETTIFFGFAGSMSTTGQWKLIKWLMERRFIDVFVPTGANISEDIQDSLHGYYQGHWLVDDEELWKLKIFRYYDVFTDGIKYRKMTDLIKEFALTLKENYPYSTREFCWLFGKFLAQRNIDCLLATAYKKKIFVFSPALVDSEYGIALVLAIRNHKKHIILDQTKDFYEITKIGEKSKKTGAVFIGGGVPKDFIQMVAAEKGVIKGETLDYPHSYAIQITTDSPQWGGLSGATFEEAISWGKEAKKGNNVQCYCDATIALPLVCHALAERLSNFKRKPPKFLEKIFDEPA
jgi:deoxyhypusine synthase